MLNFTHGIIKKQADGIYNLELSNRMVTESWTLKSSTDKEMAVVVSKLIVDKNLSGDVMLQYENNGIVKLINKYTYTAITIEGQDF